MDGEFYENNSIKPIYPFEVGDYNATCNGWRFLVSKRGADHGMKLVAAASEGFEKIIFDPEKKTVTVEVKKKRLPARTPRTLDLTDAPEFFDGLRDNIEDIILKQQRREIFKSVTPNEDRTVFTVSY